MKKLIVLAAFALIACDKRPYPERLQSHDAEEKVEYETKLKEGTQKIEKALKAENKRRIDVFNKCYKEKQNADLCLEEGRKIVKKCDDEACWPVGGEEDAREKKEIEELGDIKNGHLVTGFDACKTAASEEFCDALEKEAHRGFINRHHTDRGYGADNAWYLLNGDINKSSVYYPDDDGDLMRIHGSGPKKLKLTRAQADRLRHVKREL